VDDRHARRERRAGRDDAPAHRDATGRSTVSVVWPYQRAQDEFDAAVSSVPSSAWEAPSACAAWTLRDVAGPVIWGQHQRRHWAIGREYTGVAGGPGTPHPGELAGADPVRTWRVARAAVVATLTPDALDRIVSPPGLGERPLSAIVTLLVTDHLAH